MSSQHVDIHPEAILEAQAANRWYRERSASAADAYLAELDSAVEAIAENPEMWPGYVHGTRRPLNDSIGRYL
jgi:plasmid stabilization system protein ParE